MICRMPIIIMITFKMMIMMFVSSDHGERHVHQVCHFSPAVIVTRLKLTKKQKIIITVITNIIDHSLLSS